MWASRPLTCRARADTGTCGNTTTRSARASSSWWTPRTKCVLITCFHESSISYLLLFFQEKVVFSIKKITVILAFYVFSSSLVWSCRILNFEYLFWFFSLRLPEKATTNIQNSTRPNLWATEDIIVYFDSKMKIH